MANSARLTIAAELFEPARNGEKQGAGHGMQAVRRCYDGKLGKTNADLDLLAAG